MSIGDRERTLAIGLEFLEEDHQLVAIFDKDVFYLFTLPWIRNEQLSVRLARSKGKGTLKTWKASNWMLRDRSRRRFIISMRLSIDSIHWRITGRFSFARSISESSFTDWRFVT